MLLSLISVRAKADVWAVKSNLLYDIAGAPDIGVEYGWNRHWSVTANITSPWFVDENNEWCYEMVNYGIEGRYWLHDWNENTEYWQEDGGKLAGHFFGIYANCGKFDFGHDRMGWQSKWFWASGVSYGYSFRLTDNLRLECTLGIGYLQTDYTRYNTQYDNSGIYFVEDGTFRWFGPTKAGVSLMWVF